jgi:Domain of unknown function (DUF4145)
MSALQSKLKERFESLAKQAATIPIQGRDSQHAEAQAFYSWAASALHLLHGVFGAESPHYTRFNAELKNITNNYVPERQCRACVGAFLGAKSDFDGGFLFSLETEVAGELFGDFVATAKAALAEGHHAVAAVLACAALEDALKRYAMSNGLATEAKTMDEVVNALKSKGLVSGAEKALLSAMPKIRNYAMHAEWNKLTAQDAGSVIGYVEQFLLAHFR